ncbi:NADP-dependent oxidoreductase [Mycetocola lacteus]|uniref:NADP-dependent oxidoreductase n=1 Tax=Mycetocola lacteus TaxID=76637 RepID=A0A3L7AUB9_9MICO|nr:MULTISPECIES: NADP-dependent oxidoreductase [Mycetocola]MCS4277268.1 NADPH:quinone reductase-like Zn-dependent oxidoreductase [Mycetocola sp. BIGb0189]RLP84077.1 NADP-dependent oxidoreductase [Mycetocola lacteus]
MTSADSPRPHTMLAAVYDTPGPAQNLRLTDEVSVPFALSDEVLVRVHASALNPIDTKTRAGRGVASGIVRYPALIGSDFAGVVVRAPYEAHPLQPGTEVYGMLPVPRVSGSYAQYVAAPSLSIAPKPDNLSFTEAAAVPLAAMTAWGALDAAEIESGQRVLIHAGAGGVGHFAVQLAALRGAHVIATGSAHNLDFLRELGAAEVIDYTARNFEDGLAPVDAVIDLIGNVHANTGSRSLGVIVEGGVIVNVPSGSWPEFAAEAEAAGVRGTHYKVSPDARVLEQITALIESDQLRVVLADTYPLERIVEAHEALEAGHTRGKIAISIP